MRKDLIKIGIIIIILFLLSTYAALYAQQNQGFMRIKDMAHIQGYSKVKLIGYGLVVGLDGTGDSRSARFTINSIANMLAKFGIEIDSKRLRTRNVAAVMVTAEINPFMKKGTPIDVTISSIGDAKSLKGGTLLMTPLTINGEDIYAVAQGPTFVGGYEYTTRDLGYLKHNHTLVSRIPNGAVLVKELKSPLESIKDSFYIYLNRPDFTNALRVANAINNNLSQNYGVQSLAEAIDPSTILVRIPQNYNNKVGIMKLISDIEGLYINPDTENKIVINERTGTIVIGGDVRIRPVAIAHSNLSIRIGSPTKIYRKMVNVAQGDINVTPQLTTGDVILTDSLIVNVSGGNVNVNPTQINQVNPNNPREKFINLPATTTIQDLTNALNQLGVKPRDIITIIQLLKNAGAINAEIVVM